ncbi:MAG TPA: FAD/NAD(P)-binding protein [Burkholderiaceae bacterium]|nr:FAD/NAD(P)-binding protein [Burkholderiaceae bacterium]
MNTIDTDYLVIGSGTAGLAFTDTLIDEDKDAHVTIVDRHGRPGGHWNDAYSFVALHQPSAFYGVNSMELGSRRTDTVGLNKGLYELASGPEISAYFDRVMNHRLLASGRVAYHPMCNGLGDGVFESILSGARTQVRVRRKTVDAAYAGPAVPSTHRPRFELADGVRLVPPNALPGLWHGQRPPRRFVILGAGKTAMDACVWLVTAGADPDAIEWVVPRDAWLINRITTQPAMEFFNEAIGGQADQMQAFAEATSIDDLFLRLEACGAVLRIHRDRMPTMFHLATIAPGEVEVLRRIRHVIRLGRVQRIARDHLQLEHGRVAMAADATTTLFVDCTASAVEPRPLQPVFQGNTIVLQMVRLPQPAFSAALTAYVEAHYDGDEAKNRLCTPVPFPHTLAEYPRAVMVNMRNHHQWAQDKVLRQWIRDSRLDGFGRLVTGIDPADTDKLAIVARLKAQSSAALANLPRLIGLSGAAAQPPGTYM